jgi:hypothetical protein
MARSGGKKTQTEVLTLIDDLRARGVLYFKQGDLEINLGPVPEKEDAPVDKPPKEGKRGKDGLTAEEQEKVYGRVIDAEE